MLFDSKSFKDNTIFILPSIIKNVNLLVSKSFKKVQMMNAGKINYIDIYYNLCDEKEYKRLKYLSKLEKCFFNMTYNNESIVIRFRIPSNKLANVLLIKDCGTKYLTEKDILKYVEFWKEYSYILVFGSKKPDCSIE